MSSSLEAKALRLALSAAFVSLGGALLVAAPIKIEMGARASEGESRSWGSWPERASSPALIERGRQLFAMSCVECHGDDAQGDEGPDLHNLPMSKARMAVMIQRGEKGEMPSFAKKYDEAQVAALVGYVRSLR